MRSTNNDMEMMSAREVISLARKTRRLLLDRGYRHGELLRLKMNLKGIEEELLTEHYDHPLELADKITILAVAKLSGELDEERNKLSDWFAQYKKDKARCDM